MPFLRHHHRVFARLKTPWQWHVVEGLADLRHDTAWCLEHGGRLPKGRRKHTWSGDGTTGYLDTLQRKFPGQVKIYRKPKGQLWQGKVEMVRAPLPSLREECLLWEIDADECWTTAQIEAVVRMFQQQPRRTAAFFWCNFFVGPEALVSSRHGYSQNPQVEWLRVWRYRPGDFWASHEPPRLMRPRLGRAAVDVAQIDPFLHAETEAAGAVFDHYAYATRKQVKFKEQYYGYRGATRAWERLQKDVRLCSPLRLADYFSWVKDATGVSRPAEMGLRPLARRHGQRWEFSLPRKKPAPPPPRVLIDGGAYQDGCHYGIYRVWNSLLREWARDGFIRHVCILDRKNTFPDLAGASRIRFRGWNPKEPALETLRLERACRKHGANVFLSTMVSGPALTPAVYLHHDFIAERLQGTPGGAAWREKARQIRRARLHVCVSTSTARDLHAFFPEIPGESVRVAHPGVDPAYHPRSRPEVRDFLRHHGISAPYFLLVGERIGLRGSPPGQRGYKNTRLFFETFRAWEKRNDHQIVLVGRTEPEEELVGGIDPSRLRWIPELPEDDLARAYAGAVAVPYPSRYEGFGLPVLEAMACGCPVITTRQASLPEVGGEAPLYVDPDSRDEMQTAMEAVLSPAERGRRAALGRRQANKFRWESFSRIVAQALTDAALTRGESFPAGLAPLTFCAGWESVRSLVRNTKRRFRPSK